MLTTKMQKYLTVIHWLQETTKNASARSTVTVTYMHAYNFFLIF